jgi:hypothetical protein
MAVLTDDFRSIASQKNMGKYIKTVHNCILPRPFIFIILSHSIIVYYIAQAVEESREITQGSVTTLSAPLVVGYHDYALILLANASIVL